MANTVAHPAPRHRTVRHSPALALTPARRDADAGCGGDGRPGERRGGTEARVPVGCDHAHRDPDGVAIARDRDQRDGLVSV